MKMIKSLSVALVFRLAVVLRITEALALDVTKP